MHVITPTLLFYSVCLGIMAGCLYLLSCLWPPDSPWAPWWKTDESVGKIAAGLGSMGKNDVVFELGSGDGEFIVLLARDYVKRAVGIEIDPARHWIAVFRKLWNHIPSSKLKLERKNFFSVDISSATVVYMYLVPKAMERLLPKLKKELTPGTRIVTYRYQMKIPYVAKKMGARYPLYLYKI